MNAFLTVVPLILIRFGLLSILGKEALKRAAFFAPLIGKEKMAYWFYVGLVIYGLGVLLCLVSVLNFAKPTVNGINLKGLYRFSRNPMYVAYFIYFLGCVVLTQSLILFVLLLVFQISAHWIILSEERWCIEKFGQEYMNYMKKVRRYF